MNAQHKDDYLYSYCPRNHHILPADRCADAVAAYSAARDAALNAKQEIWADKYESFGVWTIPKFPQCDRVLIFNDRDACERQVALGGLAPAKPLPAKHAKPGTGPRWTARPLRNTRRGKQIAADLEHVADLLETWQWSLERALGIYGTVLAHGAFHMCVARALADGRVAVSSPVPQEPHRPGKAKAPQIPEWAEPISKDEYEALTAKLGDIQDAG